VADQEMTDYTQMTIGELEVANSKLMVERDSIRQKQVIIARLLDKLNAQRDAERKARAMSNAEKAALLQVLQPKGIESLEGFGKSSV